MREFLEEGADWEDVLARDKAERLDDLLAKSTAVWHDMFPGRDIPVVHGDDASRLKACLLVLWEASRQAEKDQGTPTSREEWIALLGLDEKEMVP